MRKIHTKLHILMGQHKIKSINMLSKETGITRATLTRIYDETSEQLDFKTIEKLCDYFKCELTDLLDLEIKR